ncbi:LysM domain-containing protein [Lachnellula subtilissima]|uniref:LysM domain-containing protein n=1 Tax=Lachnellula subtilissima TaxID=602034 RepID=A0A8H8RX60_9HELO|nr:LysM domain-containing protein [Lachnellula subtilissima]
MKIAVLILVTLAFNFAGAQYLISPPNGGFISFCHLPFTGYNTWVQHSYSLTCKDIEVYFGIKEAAFEKWNPITTELGPNCTLIADLYYCVAINYTPLTTPGPYTPSSTPATSTTSTSSTATVPTPLEPSTDPSCTAYHYVVSGDTCSAIEQEYGITAAEFNAWNPAVGNTCEYLDLDEYICIAAPFTSTSSQIFTSTTSTMTSSNLPYPTPLQPGSFRNCSAYHLVVSGDYCSLIESEYGITAAQGWLSLSRFGARRLCLRRSSSGLSNNPKDFNFDINRNTCSESYRRDYCSLVEKEYGITAAEFNAWNPDVGASCAYLDLGEYN